MGKYTIETLAEINAEYLMENYKILQIDINMVNEYVDMIERTRSTREPRPGDTICYTAPSGEYYPQAHIEYIADGKAYVCEQAGIHISRNDQNIWGYHLASSGGSWLYLPVSELRYIRQEEKRFWDFGKGMYRMKGINFYATVNVWECDINQEPFSTRTHDKYYLYYLKNNRQGEQFLLSNRHMGDRRLKSELEVQAWLRTYRAVISHFNENQAVVWVYKEKFHFLSPEGYENLPAEKDIIRMNGLRYCKRIYDSKNSTLHTYYVWYWNDSEKRELAVTNGMQNEIRKKYEINENENSGENQRAIEELRSHKIEYVDLSPLYL